MILAAGLSPAWQQTVLLDRLQVGEVNRAREVHWCASGKVINVGLALDALRGAFSADKPGEAGSTPRNPGDEVQSLVLIGGLTGRAIEDELTRQGLSARWIYSASPTRVCTTILDREQGVTTELVENVGEIHAEELDAFRQAFHEMVPRAEVIVLTGSFPRGTPATFYRELMSAVSGRVIVDCQGAPLLAALEARPFVVKPNREELGRTLGLPVTTDAELKAAMRALNDRGAQWVVVSQGKGPVWISSTRRILSIAPPTVSVVNPIGSGDCLAAGIATGLAAGYDLPDAVAFGVAAAAENVRRLLPARIEIPAMRRLHDSLRILDVQTSA